MTTSTPGAAASTAAAEWMPGGASASEWPADADGFDAPWHAAQFDEFDDTLPAPRAGIPSPQDLIDFAFDDAVGYQTIANQQVARLIFAVHEAFEIAREHPHFYLPAAVVSSPATSRDIDFAVRSVAFDVAQRLHLSENLVRAYDQQAGVLAARLPRLRELFLSGLISQQHVRAAVDCAMVMPDEATTTAFDERLAGIAEKLRPGEFARRCKLLRERMCADTLQVRHDAACTTRRVSIESAEDGMAWLNAYLPVMDAARIEARLQAAAGAQRHRERERRNLEQLRADAFVQLLLAEPGDCGRADGSSSESDAVDGDSDGGGSDGVRSAVPVAAASVGVQPFLMIDADGRFAELLGYGPIDPRTAAATLRNAPAFRKVFTDGVNPANLVLDRRRYRPTPDQRRWLRVRYGLDDDAAPFISPGAEVDHVIEYQHGGCTDVDNLLPLKRRLHRLKSVTRLRLDPKPDGGVRVRTPTGYDSDPPPF